VFNAAQAQLQDRFGMTLTPLPAREKITIAQKRTAQRAATAPSSTPTAYILTSTLPLALRSPAILPPPKVPSSSAEATYVALYTFVCSVIYLSEGGRCSEGKLERALKKLKAEEWVAGVKMDHWMKRMEREGYIVKVKEREVGGEESVEYVVGPRGKVEVGESGVAGVVRGVYKESGGRTDMAALEKRLERSLGVGTFERAEAKDSDDGGGGGGGTQRRGGRRRDVEVEEEEEEEEEEETRPAARTSRRSAPATQGRRRQAVEEEEDDEEEGEDEEEEDDD
jgi:hypothetical protein